MVLIDSPSLKQWLSKLSYINNLSVLDPVREKYFQRLDGASILDKTLHVSTIIVTVFLPRRYAY